MGSSPTGCISFCIRPADPCRKQSGTSQTWSTRPTPGVRLCRIMPLGLSLRKRDRRKWSKHGHHRTNAGQGDSLFCCKSDFHRERAAKDADVSAKAQKLQREEERLRAESNRVRETKRKEREEIQNQLRELTQSLRATENQWVQRRAMRGKETRSDNEPPAVPEVESQHVLS